MRRFWGFYQNGSYSVGCNGRTVYIFDKAGKEIARFNDFPYAYSAAFMPGKNIIAVKSTGGVLGFYDLDSLSLLKKITVTKIGAQDEGFGFSTDGSFFYNIEKPVCSTRTQLGIYETNSFTKIHTLFAEDEQMVLDELEIDDETNTCYLLGFIRGINNVFFVAVLDAESQTIQNIRAIDKNQYDYLSGYKHWEITGFTEKSFECSWLKYLAPKHINKTSIKEVYEAFGS